MKGKLTVFSILLAILLTLQSIYTVNSEQLLVPQFDVLSSIGGTITSVAVKDNYAYVGKGTSIIVLENFEGMLVKRGKQFNLASPVSDIKIEGEILYVADGSSGLYIVDISDPLNPTEKSVFNSGGFAETLVIKGTTIYLANGSEGLQIIDVSYPGKPVSVGQIYEGKYAFGIAVDGSTAYIASANDGLLIADIGQSNAPKELTSYDTPGIARDVAVSDKYAYVADDWKGISVIDISTPSEPVAVGIIKTTGHIHGVALDGNYLYAAAADAGLRVWDVTDAAAPMDIASYMPAGSDIARLVAYSGRIFCADRIKGILSFDANDPSDLRLEATYSPGFPMRCIQNVVKGRYVYVTSGVNGFSIVDVEDPVDPQQVSHIDFTEAVSFIKVSGDYAYLIGENCLYTVDISNPLYPVCFNEAPIGADEPVQGVDMDSDCIYLVDESHIKVFSLKDPEEPVLISSYYIVGPTGVIEASDIAVRNGIAYIAMGYVGTWVYDVSDVNNIKYLGKCPVANGYCKNIDFYGELAFINNSDINSIEILKISDTKNPVYVGAINNIRSQESNYRIGMYENYVLLPDDLEGILIEDISDPVEVKQVGRIDLVGKPVRVHIEGDKAYVVDNLGLISIIGISGSPLKNEIDKIAYITIDDGPSRNTTTNILDTLNKYGIKATFFVLPKDKMNDIYKRIIDEGHVIGNHSYSHDYGYLFSSTDGFKTDVIKAKDFIHNRLNYKSTVFRFPGGTMGRSSGAIKERADILAKIGYTYFDWDVSTADTAPNLSKYGDEEYIVNMLANNVINNTKDRKKLVILMHDSADKTYTAKALPKIIEGLKAKGYEFDVLTNYYMFRNKSITE